jgi:hypothetical protein
MRKNIDYDYEAEDRARERRYDAEQEIRAVSAVAEHFVRNNKAATGADALLMAIDLVRSADTRTVAA